MCSVWIEQFKKIDGVRAKIGPLMPWLTEPEAAIVGVKFSRIQPVKGRVLLKRGEVTVASIDLSQTGEASWMFAKYSPKEHRLVYDIKEGQRLPLAEMVYRTDESGEELENAFFLWKVQPADPASGSHPSRLETNQPPAAAGSRR